jgi:transitional endoplasmic reticulum ATPase
MNPNHLEHDPESDETTPEIQFEEAPDHSFDDIGGLEKQAERLNETLVASLTGTLEPCPATQVIVAGPYNTGRRSLVRAAAGEANADVCEVNAASDLSTDCEELFEAIERAISNEPSLIIVTEYEQLVRVGLKVKRRLIESLSELRRDGASVAFAGILDTGAPVQEGPLWDTADAVVQIDGLDEDRRLSILRKSLEKLTERDSNIRLANSVELTSIAKETTSHNYHELNRLARRAVRLAANNNGDGTVVGQTHLDNALDREHDRPELDEPSDRVGTWDENVVTPRDPTDVCFDDIGGQTRAKEQVQEYIKFPTKFDEWFEGTALDATRGILLYGPPGNGKTMLAKAIANETGRTFFSVAGPEFQTRWVGETEGRIRALFDAAREEESSVIFFDEFDSMAPNRGGCEMPPWKKDFVNTLLAELDGLEEQGDVVVIAATNRKEEIDPAILRPGRMDRHVEVPKPGRAAYPEIVSTHIEGFPIAEGLDLDRIAEMLPEGCSGAEIGRACREAAYAALREAGSDPSTTDPMIDQSNVDHAIREVQSE